MDTEYMAQRLQCSRTDKQECLQTVQQLMELAYFSREHGFLELDRYCQDNAAKFTDPFLRKAVACLADIGDYQLIQQVLNTYIITGNYTGHQFLKNIIIMETTLALHRRVGVEQIFTYLIPSYFGIDAQNEVDVLYRDFKRARGLEAARQEERETPAVAPSGAKLLNLVR